MGEVIRLYGVSGVTIRCIRSELEEEHGRSHKWGDGSYWVGFDPRA
jgi:hypothetical protein